MVVRISIRVEPRSISYRSHFRDNSLLFKEVNRAVDGVQRHRRQTPPHPFEDGVGRGMLFGTGQLTEYLQSLVGHPDATVATLIDEAFHSLLDFRSGQAHASFPPAARIRHRNHTRTGIHINLFSGEMTQ